MSHTSEIMNLIEVEVSWDFAETFKSSLGNFKDGDRFKYFRRPRDIFDWNTILIAQEEICVFMQLLFTAALGAEIFFIDIQFIRASRGRLPIRSWLWSSFYYFVSWKFKLVVGTSLRLGIWKFWLVELKS